MFEPELHLGEDIMVPDVAGWRRDRLSVEADVAYSTIPPDWLCEILSPGTERFDRAYKLPRYAAAGVQYLWLIHPVDRTLEVQRLHEGKWLILATYLDDAMIRAEPFEAISFDLAQLWLDFVPPSRANEPVALYETSR